MAFPARTGVILSLVLLLATGLYSAPPDLNKRITIHLADAAMANAAMAISKLGGVGVVAPSEPSSGISMYLKDEPLTKVLVGLAAASGTEWDLLDDLIVFSHPTAESKPSVAKVNEVLTPEQIMAEIISSLDSVQLYRVAAGNSIAYGEMNSYQQDLLKSMLSPPAVGISEVGGTIHSLPTPEQASISFISLPYFVVPNGDKQSLNLRLDTTSYTLLRKGAAR